MRSPKQKPTRSNNYRYYAGFSDAFVADVLNEHAVPGCHVFDPWNGSGMTTAICASHGLQSTGIDANPATLPVAWARLARQDLVQMLCDAVVVARDRRLVRSGTTAESDEMLDKFFVRQTADLIRGFRVALIELPMEIAEGRCEAEREEQALSGAAFLILSQVIREALGPLRGTNPSWIRRPKNASDRIELSQAHLRSKLNNAAVQTSQSTLFQTEPERAQFAWPTLLLGDSKAMPPLGDFDLVISSPPYCTRIDYAVATIPELLALGITETAFSRLRRQLMGTVLTEAQDSPDVHNVSSVQDILDAIGRHPTKAAATYYHRYFLRYFSDLSCSVAQIRHHAPSATVVLVVQNSYFKNVQIDLAKVLQEMMESHGYSLKDETKYSKKQIAVSNPRSKIYRQENVQLESVLTFLRA